MRGRKEEKCPVLMLFIEYKKYRDRGAEGGKPLLLEARQKLWVILAAGISSYPGYTFPLSRQDILWEISGVIAEIFKSGLA